MAVTVDSLSPKAQQMHKEVTEFVRELVIPVGKVIFISFFWNTNKDLEIYYTIYFLVLNFRERVNKTFRARRLDNLARIRIS